MSKRWHPIETLLKAYEAGKFDGEECSSELLLWNPCDGLHVMWPISFEQIKDAERHASHWRLPPDPPADSPKRL